MMEGMHRGQEGVSPGRGRIREGRGLESEQLPGGGGHVLKDEQELVEERWSRKKGPPGSGHST